MSDASETKTAAEIEEANDPGAFVNIAKRLSGQESIGEQIARLEAEVASLKANQSAVCGPGLTSDEKAVLIGLSEDCKLFLSKAPQTSATSLLRRRAEVFDNLLTRDAERADAVTLRRESLALLMTGLDEYWVTFPEHAPAIAEAEAALAKGGE